ncbi:MAG: phosphoribosylformylglycinamidine synthase subunit PurQ [Thermoanaerobacteraceae bacterium]|nr:phosphoribosylformylglycinamidine synthase subunit PurQ [Thermoanaerobacteraceae bacterium]
MKFGVVVFPGSNCDADVKYVIDQVLKQPVDYIWHQEADVSGYDCLVLPGGFSFGDYLRIGAIARFSPVMKGVERFARDGGLVIGICNGFQILLEAGLLPGAMKINDNLQFRCHDTFLRVENATTPFTGRMSAGQVVKIPIAHGEGNYYADEETLAELEKNGQVVFRYSTPEGEITREANPNGSTANIAGIVNKEGNVLGMMPHPERCAEAILGGEDGKLIFQSIVDWLERGGNSD